MKQTWQTRAWISVLLLLACSTRVTAQGPESVLDRIGTKRGIVALLDLPRGGAAQIVDLVKSSELTILFQSDQATQVEQMRRAAEEAGLLGTRIFADDARSLKSIQLADNVADGVLVAASAIDKVSDEELLRVIQPRSSAFVGKRRLVKTVPDGADDWSHPYHGPDNNPLSNDTLVRGNLHTQFIGYPKFSPMPEQTVVAGGRIFKAMGHIAHKANQNEMLNTLFCINAYNGTILWKRSNPPGFMIHRNTMIATEDALYMGDHESCKIFDAKTGELRDQITVDPALTDGPVWKWMAIQGNVLYALVGNPEISISTQRSARAGLGHWPWGMWEGHDYKDPRTAFGYGRTLVAIDLDTKAILWHYRDEEFLDARAVCMSNDRIYCYCPENFLVCIDARDGKLLWKNTDKDLLEAIGPNGRAQHYVTGYSTSCYMKSSDNYVFFAGPQRTRLVVASTANGKLAWTYPIGNLQVVLRDDAMWAAGPQDGKNGVKLDYGTGNVLAEFPARRACTRATGCADSIFFRANGGTVRVLTETNNAQHFDPMRPPCQDGVIISNGHLYWGPWMCGCQLSLYGNICLRPETADGGEPAATEALIKYENPLEVEPLGTRSGDWPIYRANNARNDVSNNVIPSDVKHAWEVEVCANALPTAPVAAGGMVFVADRTGVVQAFDNTGKSVWKSYTAGPVYYPPTIAHDRLFVGSADGNVYALEARTGRKLWQYRVGPVAQRIPVYGHLISQYPIAGGVVVQDDTVYAAAGITHYDGTFVVALDAVTGEIKARNDTSGTLDPQVNNGISLQGNLTIVDGELRFLAGGVYETARYDLETLKCLNKPVSQVSSQFRTAFYPYYPAYGKFVSLDYTRDDGHLLNHDASYEGSVFTNLALHEPLPPGETRPRIEAARWMVRRGQEPPQTIWQDKANRRFTSFIVSGDTLLATGHPDASPDKPFIAAMNIQNGSDRWLRDLPADPVKGGCAIDHDGHIYLTLENGVLMCLK
jgi:outer membrane protein assembly factor BamB